MTTKICSKCKITKNTTEFRKDKSKHDGLYSSCKECKKKYLNTPESIAHRKEHMKNYQQQNREILAKKAKEYRKENIKWIRPLQLQYYQNNREELLKQKQEYYFKNAERIKEEKKEYRKNMTEEQIQKERLRSRINGHKRRKLAGNHLSIKIIRKLLEQYKHKCYYCGTKIIHTERNSYHIDHYVPVAKGGTSEISNLVISCPTCNMSKGAKMPHEFMLKLGKLF